MKVKFFVLSLIFVMGSRLFAGGFQINEHGARAMAMGGAFTALALDPSSLYFNSAAIARLSGMQFMAGTTVIAPSVTFRGPYGPDVSNPTIAESKMSSQLFTPSHAYFTYRINDKMAVGLGFNNPFGLGTQWEDNWVGRFVSIKADVQTFSFNPVFAYNVMDNLSIGVGLQYNFGKVTLKRAIGFPPFAGEAMVNLEGKDNSAIGFTGGVLYNPMKNFSVGVSYRSEVEYGFEGTATSTGPSQLAGSLPKGAIKATLKSPQQVVVGLGYMLNPELTLSADFQYVAWSSYDSLKVEFVDTKTSSAAPREYKNTFIVRFGAEYKLHSSFDLLGGILYDKNPVNDERVDASLPDADRIGLCIGGSYHLTKSLDLDASYMFLRFAERTITTSKVNYSATGTSPMNGTYNSTAGLYSFSLSYKF